MIKALKRVALGASIGLLCLGVYAHDGEDHSAPKPAVNTSVRSATASPQFVAQTDQFELVGNLQGNTLTLYLDHFASNAPVPGAQIELESGAWKGSATESSAGVYRVVADPLAHAGKHAITITVQAGDASDLMEATLETGAQIASQVSGGSASVAPLWQNRTTLGAALLLALGALGALTLRRRQSGRTSSTPVVASTKLG